MKSAAVNLDVGHVWQGGGFKFDQKQKGKSKSLVNRISIAVQFTNVNEGDEFLVILSVHWVSSCTWANVVVVSWLMRGKTGKNDPEFWTGEPHEVSVDEGR